MRAFAIILFLLLVIPTPSRAANLTVVIEGLRSHNGILQVALFENGKGFPHDSDRAVARRSIDLRKQPEGQSPSVTFESLPPGTFAVSVLHDEDGDGKLKTSWLGKPKEGIGTSNNPPLLKGPPKFESAAFHVEQDLRIALRIAYLF